MHQWNQCEEWVWSPAVERCIRCKVNMCWTMKLPFGFVDTQLLTSCGVTSLSNAASVAFSCHARESVASASDMQSSLSHPRPELPCRQLTDTGGLRCWVSALIHANMSCLTVCRPLARAPHSWAHAAPAAPAAPYKHFIPGGKTAHTHTV